MSLKAFHIFFIVVSDVLTLCLGVWALVQHQPVSWAITAFAGSVALNVYLAWFLVKSKDLGRS